MSCQHGRVLVSVQKTIKSRSNSHSTVELLKYYLLSLSNHTALSFAHYEAAPLADAAVVAASETDAVRERNLEKRDVLCLNRGPKVGFSLAQVDESLLI
jgi:hypothetical protein